MAQKAKKKPAKMGNRNHGTIEAVKDDGEKYAVVNDAGKPVYPGQGVALTEAVRLATSLVSGAGLARIESDGALTPGRLDTQSGTFQPAA
jgi:hypothetical protein